MVGRRIVGPGLLQLSAGDLRRSYMLTVLRLPLMLQKLLLHYQYNFVVCLVAKLMMQV